MRQCLLFKILNVDFSFEVGATYKIYWDGIAYICAACDFNGSVCVGNRSVLGQSEDEEDTGEPFFIFQDNQTLDMFAPDMSEEAISPTVAISRYDTEIVKIDKKYLPDNPLSLTSATVGQIAKISAVDDNGVPTAWEPVDLPSGGGPSINFDLIVDHTVTAEDLTVSRLTWTNATIPNLGKYNLFYAAIESDAEFGLTKWVAFFVNGERVGQFSGTSATKSKVLPVTCSRCFGRWIGSYAYNAVISAPFPALIGPCQNMEYRSTAEDATSIGIGSYAADFGLVEGMHIRVYAMV